MLVRTVYIVPCILYWGRYNLRMTMFTGREGFGGGHEDSKEDRRLDRKFDKREEARKDLDNKDEEAKRLHEVYVGLNRKWETIEREISMIKDGSIDVTDPLHRRALENSMDKKIEWNKPTDDLRQEVLNALEEQYTPTMNRAMVANTEWRLYTEKLLNQLGYPTPSEIFKARGKVKIKPKENI